MWGSLKRASVLGPAQLLWYPRNLHLVNPLNRECASISEKNDQQTNTQGNLSLIPLPKFYEMYANVHGARIFTTLDLRKGFYHIRLDKESKGKTAFFTPFGKYEFRAILVQLGTSSCLF